MSTMPCAFELQVLHLVAADGGGGGIGAVRGVGDEHLAARIALRLVIGAGQQDAGELAMRAGRRLQRDGVHAGDFDQRILRACACTCSAPCESDSGW